MDCIGLCWGYTGMMQKKMETSVMGFRVHFLGFGGLGFSF